MVKNRKGFTLIELLSVIIILGILSVIAIISIYKILEKSEKSYYTTQEKLITLAGKDYFTSNQSQLPRIIGETKKVTLETLINEKYIDPVLDKNKKSCYTDASYVSVKKQNKTKYEYYVYLVCPNHKGEEQKVEAGNAVITFTPNTSKSNKTITVKMKITGENIASYKYVIKNKITGFSTSSANEVYTGDEIEIKLADDGKYEITGYAYDTSANTIKGVSGEYIVDKIAPTCGTVTGASTTWTKNNRDISVTCNDTTSGCKTATTSATFSQTLKTGVIQIEDNVGNVRNCVVNVYIDKDAPTCGAVTGASTTWTKDDRTITTGCSDSDSECSTATFSKTFDTSITTGTITISDKAGNTRACNVNAYVDKDAPTCTSSGGNADWTSGSRTLTGTCSDTGGSSCSNATVTKTYSTNTNSTAESPGQVCDKAGNCTTCPANQTVKIDTVAPTCSWTGQSTTWTKNDRTISVTCADTGGSGCNSSYSSKSWDYKSGTTKTAELSYTIKDVAGNSTECKKTADVYVDQTAPKCTSSGGSSSWTNNNVTITGTCSDTGGSGCKNATVTATYKNEIETTEASPGTVTDNVGNTQVCPNQTVKIDKTKPTATMTKTLDMTWCIATSTTEGYEFKRLLTITWTDPGEIKSGIDTTSDSYSFTCQYGTCRASNTGSRIAKLCTPSTSGTYSGSIKDKAGNEGTLSGNFD